MSIDMADTSMELHSRDQVWKAIGDVAKQQASADARLSSLSTTVENGFTQLQHSVQELIRRQSIPFPIWNMVSAVGVLAVILGGYSTLISQPLYATTARHYQAIEELQKDRAKIAALQAQIEDLEQDLRDVDRYGSRRWSKDTNE